VQSERSDVHQRVTNVEASALIPPQILLIITSKMLHPRPLIEWDSAFQLLNAAAATGKRKRKVIANAFTLARRTPS